MQVSRSAAMRGWNPAPSGLAADTQVPKGKIPNKIIPVPHEYRRDTLARERDTLVNNLKISTDCIVMPHWEQGSGQITRFEIHGSGAGVEKAVRHLNQWISNALIKSNKSAAWAKMPAFDADKWYYEQVEQMENERKQQFKGPAPQFKKDEPRLPTIIMPWPQELSEQSPAITPREAFGNRLEALDGLRMQDEVFITLIPPSDGSWQIELVAFEVANVEAAEEHVRTLIEKVSMESLGLRHTLNMVLDEREGMNVELQQDEPWWPNHFDRIVPRLLPSPMMNEPGSFRQEGLHSTQLSVIQHHIKLALESIRHRKGSYDFVVRLGCLALSSKHVSDDTVGELFAKEKFIKEINTSVDLDVKKWLANDETGYRVLHRITSANDFLEPTKSAGYYGHTPKSLKATRPMFRGTWVFRDPNSVVNIPRTPVRHPGRPVPPEHLLRPIENAKPSQMSMFVVQVDWEHDEEGEYEKGIPRYYKLEAGKQGPKMHMDINLLELGESRGWHFALESLMPVSHKAVPPILTGFAQRVSMKKKYDISSNKSFAEWDSTPTINKYLATGRLDSIYSFGIKKSCYKVEVTAMWYPTHSAPVWSLGVRHIEWATHLAELERLAPGHQATWDHTITTFLPDDGESSSSSGKDKEDFGIRKLNLRKMVEEPPRPGIRILVEKLMQLSDIVSSVTAEGGVRL